MDYGGYPQAPARNGMGTAALVLGILALVFAILFFPVGLVLGILAVIFGFIGRGRANRGEATNGGAATAGLVMGILGLIASIAIAVFAGSIFNKVKDCAELDTQAEVERCVEDKLND